MFLQLILALIIRHMHGKIHWHLALLSNVMFNELSLIYDKFVTFR